MHNSLTVADQSTGNEFQNDESATWTKTYRGKAWQVNRPRALQRAKARSHTLKTRR